MKTITIIKSPSPSASNFYWAIAPDAKVQTPGLTAGEALDNLNRKLETRENSAVIIQRQEADDYFTEAQMTRLQYLLDLTQSADGLPPEDESELERLIDSEIQASGQRAGELADALGR